MLPRCSFDRAAEADRLKTVIAAVLEHGCRTRDIAQEGDVKVSTSGMGDAILKVLDRPPP